MNGRQLYLVIICFLFSGIHADLNAAQVRVVTEEYPPYNYTENGKVTGVFTELVEAILKTAGIDYSIAVYPWARSYQTALHDPNVLIYGIVRTKERENLFKWVDMILPFNIYLFKLRERTDIRLSNLEDAKQYTVGAVRGDVREQYFKKKGFAKLDLVSRNDLNLKKFYNGRFDLIAIDEISAAYFCKKEGYDFSKMEKALLLTELSEGLYIAFSNNTPESLAEQCRNAFQQIKANGDYGAIKATYLK